MSRPLTIIALLLAVIGIIFHLSHVGAEFVPVLNWIALGFLAAGVLTGR